ncbi:MAG: glutamate 5-kinase [Kiritimatiellia bacterium]|jgi:glutamate 5-kinase|nr:glutamate 5-kinase [Lentisphaerota bacterium]
MASHLQIRKQLDAARRVVVKIGSRTLVQRNGRPDTRRMAALVADIAELRKAGREVVVVSSGAIAAGLQALGMTKKPADLPSLQMAAAVGQSRLMATYDNLFARKKLRIGQVLLTHDDLENRRRHLNARNTMLKLLEYGVIPIVNENDVVSADEIKFGDNDLLASRSAMLIGADLLVLLTTVNGFHAPDAKGRRRRVPFLSEVTADTLSHAKGKGSALSTGGMSSKLTSAMEAARMGTAVVIANGRKDAILQQILAGKNVGTLIAPSPMNGAAKGGLNQRRRWVALFHHARGQVVIDEGACVALLQRGKSLLPVGVRDVIGEFSAGDLVEIHDPGGRCLARGLSEYSSAEIRLLKGLKTEKIRELLGNHAPDELIHRDNLVIAP